MSEIVFTLEPTPNPNAYKFVADRTLRQGPPFSCQSPAAARDEPVAAALFAVPGIVGVMILDNFLTVSQDGSRDWADLTPQIQAVLGRVFSQL